MKLKDLIVAQNALAKLWNNDKLPAKTAFKVGKLLRTVGVEFEEFDKQRTKLAQLSDTAEAEKQLEELLEEDITLPDIKVSLGELDGLSPAELMSIEWLIDDKLEEA